MPRTENFLFGTDPMAGYTVGGEAATLLPITTSEFTTQARQMRYGNGDASVSVDTDKLYVEPQKLSEYDAPGARSLDDVNRMIIFGQYTASGTSVGQLFVEFSRGDVELEYENTRFGPFPFGRWSPSDAGAGPALTVVDNPFPSDFMRTNNGAMTIDDPLWCRTQLSLEVIPGGSLTNTPIVVVVLLVNGATASQASPHRGAFLSERRFW
jgi:hypothetical protein